MKFLCVSDQIDPLVYSTNVKTRFADVDAILCAGDLPSDYIDFIVSSLNKPTYFIFGNHNLTEFQFYHRHSGHTTGAHPTMQITKTMLAEMEIGHGAIYAGFRVLKNKRLPITTASGKKRPLLIAGASGSIRYNQGLSQYTNRQMFWHLIAMMPFLLLNKLRYGVYLDIFLTHASPRHIHDRDDPCHKGFDCFNWFIQKFKPAYLVHGHIHLYDLAEQRITTSGMTTVVNAYSHCIIELDENKIAPAEDNTSCAAGGNKL